MRSLAVTLGLALSVTAFSTAHSPDKPIELKLAHWLPVGHPQHKSMEDWGASLNKASGGSITFKLFPAQQLGKAFDHYDMARDGIADVTYVNPGFQPGRFPIIGAGELPLMIKNAKGGSQAFDEWYRKYAAAEMKDVKFCVGYLLDPGSFHSKAKKITAPADIKGLKIRPANATMAAMVTELGGTNVQGAAPEVRDFLEKGVVDAITFPWGSIVLFGADKVTKYHMDVPLYVTTLTWVMNKAKYDGMSERQKKAVDDHCNNEWAARIALPQAEFENSGHAKLAALPDHEVYTLNAEQVTAWRTATATLETKWSDAIKKSGGDPKAILDGLKASLKKYDAAF